MAQKMAGKCLCGAVTVSMELKNDTFDACHCGMCRRWGGGPFLTVHGNDKTTVTGQEFISAYSSSDWAERGFCKRCGTHLFYQLKKGGLRVFSFGLFEGAENLQFHQQIFIDRKPPNYSFAEKTKTMTEAQVFAQFAPPPV